jgi:hypothetical protein
LTLQTMRENGDILGRPDKRAIVVQWRKEHPDGRKVDCIQDTGLSKPTVLKWWDSIPLPIEPPTGIYGLI